MKVLVILAMAVVAVTADPFIRYIHELQSPSGGFHELGVESADLHTTSNALFLSALYGLKAQINADDALQFVQSLESSVDNGYASSAGLPSTLEATRDALVSYLHLNKPIPNAQLVGDFIRSLFNVNANLFAARPGETGDLKSTALAIQSLEILGELDKPVVKEMLKRTRDLLTERVVGADTLSFSFEQNSETPLADNYYALVLAKHSGFAFADTDKWAKFITQRQDLDAGSPTFGGFFGGVTRDTVSASSTAFAARSLALLGKQIGNEEALDRYTAARKGGLVDTSLSHLAFAHTSLYKQSIKTRVTYDSSIDSEGSEQVMEGTQLRPRVWVTVLDGKLPHGGFNVKGHSSNDDWSSDLTFDVSHYSYSTTTDFDTKDRLGPVSFSFQLKTNVYPIGEISLQVEDDKRIGYHIDIESEATLGERPFEQGTTVPAGTEFRFGVSLATQSNPSFFKGPFKLEFSVQDASHITHHSETVDGSSNTKPLEFTYQLTGRDFPSGQVSFVIQVSDKAGNVHSSKSVVYLLDQSMVAAHIEFNADKTNPTYKLGDQVSVTIQPGSLIDMRTVAPFSSTHAAKRSFELRLSSPQGQTITAIKGTPVSPAPHAAYKFDFELPTSFDVVGTSVVSFHFVTASGDSLDLHPFDSNTNELFDDASSLTLTVKSDVHITQLETAPPAQVTFGTSIPLRFQLIDRVSSKHITPGQKSSVVVTLVSASSDAHQSARVTAHTLAGQASLFDVTLPVDGNAVRGKNTIQIQGVSVDGEAIVIHSADSTAAVSFDVTIGGDIAVTSQSFTTKNQESTKTAFIVTLGLTCDSAQLPNTRLVANVLSQSGKTLTPVSVYGRSDALSNLAVAHDQNNVYSLSFTVPHDAAASGDYVVQILRQVDAVVSKDQAKPLLELPVRHKNIENNNSVLQLEVLTVLVFAGFYFAISSHARVFKDKRY